MILFPPAKINLGLCVTEKRKDGFHNIDTVMIPVPWKDILEIVPSKKFNFTQSGLPIGGKTNDNLCVKAYHLMLEKVKNSFPVHIHLHKQIPMGSGLGGGSSDASYTLKALNEIWNAQFSTSQLERLAEKLGSDCPFFIDSSPKYCTSKGEKMHAIEVDLTAYWIKIIVPNIAINTPSAYQKITPKTIHSTSKDIVQKNILSWKDELKNDFEEPIFKANEDLVAIKHQLYDEGAIYASMSGSGSCIYGIFKENPKQTTLQYKQIILAL